MAKTLAVFEAEIQMMKDIYSQDLNTNGYSLSKLYTDVTEDMGVQIDSSYLRKAVTFLDVMCSRLFIPVGRKYIPLEITSYLEDIDLFMVKFAILGGRLAREDGSRLVKTNISSLVDTIRLKTIMVFNHPCPPCPPFGGAGAGDSAAMYSSGGLKKLARRSQSPAKGRGRVDAGKGRGIIRMGSTVRSRSPSPRKLSKYNMFVSKYFKSHKGAGLSDAVAAWNKTKK